MLSQNECLLKNTLSDIIYENAEEPRFPPPLYRRPRLWYYYGIFTWPGNRT